MTSTVYRWALIIRTVYNYFTFVVLVLDTIEADYYKFQLPKFFRFLSEKFSIIGRGSPPPVPLPLATPLISTYNIANRVLSRRMIIRVSCVLVDREGPYRHVRCWCKYWKNWHWSHRQWIHWSTDNTGTPIFTDILDTSMPVNVGVPVSSVLLWTRCQCLPVISKLTPHIPRVITNL